MSHHKAQACDVTETTRTVIDSSQVTEHCGVNWLRQNSQALVAHLLYAGVCHLPQQATEQIRLGDDDAKRNQTFRLRSSRQPRRRWVNNIRMDLQEVGCEYTYMDWIGLAQDRDGWRTLVSAVMNLRVP